MIQVNILEPDDVIYAEDWCRPLQIVSMNGGHSDYYSFKSQYTGCPENNAEWVKVKHVIGSCWFGKTVKQFHKEFIKFNCRYEFVRGDIPKTNQLDMSGYNSLYEFEKEANKNDDIPF